MLKIWVRGLSAKTTQGIRFAYGLALVFPQSITWIIIRRTRQIVVWQKVERPKKFSQKLWHMTMMTSTRSSWSKITSFKATSTMALNLFHISRLECIFKFVFTATFTLSRSLKIPLKISLNCFVFHTHYQVLQGLWA